MKTTTALLLLTLGLTLGACKCNDCCTECDADETEEVVELADLPASVREAALKAVPGLQITEAEVEGDGIYCVHGTNAGVFTEVEVDAKTGRVLEVETGADDEDGDDD
ncbi:MAG: PepSY domain-containing protein [Planctomycetes bacterium]|nr:PepSY domain-containing protein [Planctomycetota bacterium]